ncbi:MAG: sortase [Anaerolineae bacterium]|nr:sortase [Anaerolineae bacterium]
MDKTRQFRRTMALGLVIAILGLACVGGGVALLIWRLAEPEQAVLLPPGMDDATPTPGALAGITLEPPPLPENAETVVILPVSERLTATPTGDRIGSETQNEPSTTPTPTETVTRTPTFVSTETPSRTPTGTPTATPAALAITQKPTRTVIPPATESLPPTRSPAPSETPPPTRTPTATPRPVLPDRILIDAIGLDAPVVPVGQHPVALADHVYSQWDVPDAYAVGWHQNSAPLGRPGNTVLNGHHNTSGEVFRYLVALQPGDIITLEAAEQRYYYLVAQTMTLAEEGQPVDERIKNARWILPTRDERVTLITCWPYSSNTHRLVVIALPFSSIGHAPELP